MKAALLFVIIAAISYGLTAMIRRYALQHSILDRPNERSSHSVPTPRGGGAAIVAALLIALGVLHMNGQLPTGTALALLGVVPVAWIGWVDDRRGASPLVRAAVHLGAAVWALAWLGGMPTLRILGSTLDVGLVGSVVAAVGIVWATNLYNFMDGIDGLAGAEALTVACAGALLLALSGATGLALLSLASAAAALGFLIWNWAPARIFMGDVGSGALGFWFAVLAVASEHSGNVPATLWGLVAGVFVVDATLTLLRRARRGERLYAAHRTHAYQRLVEWGWPHRRVTLGVIALNAMLAAFAVLGQRFPTADLVAVAAGFTVLAVLWAAIDRRAPVPQAETGTIQPSRQVPVPP